MQRRISQKWRPSLALILAFTVGAAFCLPPAAILASRWLGREIGYDTAQWLFGIATLILAVVLVWVLWRILYGPISELSSRAGKIKRGEQGALEPMQHYGTREMQELGQAMLDMGRVLQGREAILRSYADHATHELKSPLTVVRGAAELLAEGGLSQEDQTKLIAKIEASAGRMAKLLDAQRNLASAQDPLGQGNANLYSVIEGMKSKHSALGISIEGNADISMPEENLRLVFGHLFGNARAHGAKNIRVQAMTQGFEIVDDGPGVSEGNRDRVFDPFFTTRRETGGTGMGLAIVRRMLAAHGGEITLGPNGPGARFIISFA